jgi:glutathione S-transferase
MYKLYYSPGACSMGPHVILNELNVPFEAIKIELSKGEGQKPDFLKLNPRGQIPLLIDEDGTPVKEGAAIIAYLLDKHGSPLWPKSGPDRAQALSWLMWANASLHPAYGRTFWINKNIADEKLKAEALKIARDQIQSFWNEAEERLAKTGAYLAGKTLTPGDILMTMIANWGEPGTYKLGPNVMRVIKEVSARPAYQKALRTEQVEYKAAA